MSPHRQGYTKKLGDTLRENEELKLKVLGLERACTYPVMVRACDKFTNAYIGFEASKIWTAAVIASLNEINPGGE
jgi:hypothetical protein